MKKLIIVAHPNYEQHSKNIKTIINAIQKQGKDTDIHFLDPKGKFDIEKEQSLISKYDIITFAFPLWWYSFPWTLKKWMDEVLTAGFAFSFKGDISDFKLKGKKFSYIVSVGNIAATYKKKGGNKHSIPEYLNLFDGLSHLLSSGWSAGGTILKQDKYFIDPIISFGGATGTSNPEAAAEEYLKRIDSL